MKFLVIPDVHNRFAEAEALIAKFPGHKVVFLGDYFDSFEDTPTQAGATAEWLRWSLGQGRIHIMGNHDLPYRWQYQFCPGWTAEKHRAVRAHIKEEQWQQTRLALIIQKAAVPTKQVRPLVLSHAGFTLANLYGVADFRDVASGGRCEHLRKRLPSEYLEDIRRIWMDCVRAGDARGEHFWFNKGTRMGRRDVGGPFWIDRYELRSPLPGVDQIVGHTGVRRPSKGCWPNRAKPSSEVWFIDGGGRYAAEIDFGAVSPTGGMLVTPIHARGEKIGQPWV